MAALAHPTAHRCPTWCATTHRPDDHPDDRVCMSERPGDEILTPDRHLQTYLRRELDGRTSVALDVHAITGGGISTELTVADARQIAAAVLTACDLTDGRVA